MNRAFRRTLLALVLAGGTAAPSVARAADARLLQLEWSDQAIRRQVAAYLLTSLLPITQRAARVPVDEQLASPPFVVSEGRVAIDLSRFDERSAAALESAAQPAGGGLRLSYESLLKTAEPLYGDRRPLPDRFETLRGQLALDDAARWRVSTVRSLISRGDRRIVYPLREVLETAAEALERGGLAVFPPGTAFVAEELETGGTVVETHVLVKRPDQEWDFALYDATGARRAASPREPSRFRAPSLCFTCHQSARVMPPFREFPRPSAPVSGFAPEVRGVWTPEEQEILASLEALKQKGDSVLGVYGPIAAVELRRMRAAAPLPAWAAAVWARLAARVPVLAR